MIDKIELLVEQGFALHWLHNRAKRPIGDDWSSKPVATIKELERTYKTGNNVGVRLGKPSQVGDLFLHVIDVDIRVAEDAEVAKDHLLVLFPNYTSWPCVASGSGGESRHFYFLTDKPFTSKKLAHSKEYFRDAEGKKHWNWEIELFGTGKQVVIPPSIHPDTGKAYRWISEFDFDLLEMGIGPIINSSEMPDAASAAIDSDDEDDLLSLVRTPPMGLTSEEIRDLIFALPTEEWCEDRDGWLHVGMAIHHETQGSDEGFDIWCDFSERSSKFNLKNQRQVWKSFSNDGSNVKTMGSLKKVLKDEGADFMQCKAKLDLATKYNQAIKEAAKYDLRPTEIDTILPRLMALAESEGRVAKAASIKKDLAAAKKEDSERAESRRQKSLEDWLADEVLRVFYAGGEHLRRFSKLYWVYEKGVWRMLESEVIANRTYRVVTKIIKGASSDDYSLQEILDESGRIDTLNALVNSVVGIIDKRSANESREDPLGLCNMEVNSVMNCKNGELWFDNGEAEFTKHDPDNMLLTQLRCNYEPETDSPEWDKALRRIFRDVDDTEDVIRHLHEILGYIIQPTRNLAAWVMFYGSGANGKSFVASILQRIMGEKSWIAKSLADFGRSGNNHAEAALVGKLLMIDDDYKKGALLPDDILKKMSETKSMTANPKNASEFNFVCRTTPMILVNHWPKTSDMSYGLERRALVFHFNSTLSVEERDSHLESRISKNELPGILNHLIAGWCRLQKRGHFIEPESCRRAKNAWLSKRNSMATFISDCLMITGDHGDRVPGNDLWETFQWWTNQDHSGTKWGRNNFYDEICGIPGVEKTKPKGITYFHGVRLVKVPTPFDFIEDDDDLI